MVDRRVTGLDEGSWWRCSHEDESSMQCQHVLQDTTQPPPHSDHPSSPMVAYQPRAVARTTPATETNAEP
jgi:hypothetical protein